MAIFIFTSLDPYISTWFTPTFLFCFLNIMIATIYIASNFKSHHHHQEHEHKQITRAPSLLQRVKSIDFSFQNYVHHDPFVYAQNPDSSQLQRAPSLLERVKSFSLYKQEQHQPDPTPLVQYPSFSEGFKSKEEQYQPYTKHDPTRLVRYPSFLERVKSFSLSKEEQHHPHLDPDPDQESEHSDLSAPLDQPKLVRYPTLLQRVKSIKAALYYSEQSELDSNEVDDHVVRSEKTPARVAAKMKKSASVKNVGPSKPEEEEDVNRRRPETVRGRHRSDAPSFGEDEEVDAKADDFINKFKQQLKLQRLDSLIRYKEMLNRK